MDDKSTKRIDMAFNSRVSLFDLDKSRKMGPMAQGSPKDVPAMDIYMSPGGTNTDTGRKIPPTLWGSFEKLFEIDRGRWLGTTSVTVEDLGPEKAAEKLLANGTYWIAETREKRIYLLAIKAAKVETRFSGKQPGFMVTYRELKKQ